MRNEDELVNDLTSKPSFQWNSDLASEFNFDMRALITAMNDYSYTIPSEKTIHSSGRLNSNAKSDVMYSKEGVMIVDNPPIEDPAAIYPIMASYRRKISGIEAPNGHSFRGYLFFGIEFENFSLSAGIFDGCVFNNCTFSDCSFDACFFTASKFIECQFAKSTLSGAKFSKASFYSVNFVECDIEDSMFFDNVMHAVGIYGCELDGASFLSGSFHRMDVETSSFKRSSLCGLVVSSTRFINSNFKSALFQNNRFVASAFDALHVEGAFQTENAYIGCTVGTDLLEFFYEVKYEAAGDGEEGNGELRDRSFDEIMGGDDDEE